MGNVARGTEQRVELLNAVTFDVLISNLPHRVTIDVLALLPKLEFRSAIITLAEQTDLTWLTTESFESEIVTRIGGTDFSPSQDSFAQVVKLPRAR